MKLAGHSKSVIMKALGIKNDTQIETWMKWYRNGETQRFYQPVGKQYAYKKGIDELSEVERLRLRIKQLEMHNELLGKLNGLLEKIPKKQIVDIIEPFKGKYSVQEMLAFLEIPKSNYYR